MISLQRTEYKVFSLHLPLLNKLGYNTKYGEQGSQAIIQTNAMSDLLVSRSCGGMEVRKISDSMYI